jgi:hypothetical protein
LYDDELTYSPSTHNPTLCQFAQIAERGFDLFHAHGAVFVAVLEHPCIGSFDCQITN